MVAVVVVVVVAAVAVAAVVVVVVAAVVLAAVDIPKKQKPLLAFHHLHASNRLYKTTSHSHLEALPAFHLSR